MKKRIEKAIKYIETLLQIYDCKWKKVVQGF